MEPTKRLRWPARIVLVSIAAILVEVGLVVALGRNGAVLTVSRVGLVTSLVCAVAGLVGLFQKPRTIGTAICAVGLVVGIVGLALTLFVELIVHAFSGVSF